MKPSDKIRADEREKIRKSLESQPKMKMAAAHIAKMDMTQTLKTELGRA